MRVFHTVCRTRQFFNVCRTTCFFGINWTTLSSSTFHTLLFLFSLSTELQFGQGLWPLIHLFILLLQEERSYELNVASIRGTCPYLTHHTFKLFGGKYKLWHCCLYNILCPLFALPNMSQNYCPDNFSSILSVWIFCIYLQSAIFSNRWSATSGTGSLDMSTYLRHQSFNL